MSSSSSSTDTNHALAYTYGMPYPDAYYEELAAEMSAKSKDYSTRHVTQDDIDKLKKLGIDYNTDLVTFLVEIKNYFLDTPGYFTPEQINMLHKIEIDKNLNCLNNIFYDYPSLQGSRFMSDIFFGLTDYVGLSRCFSDKSLVILEFFYNVEVEY